jgi:uncharacterized protein YndB with AHSA1/START domain
MNISNPEAMPIAVEQEYLLDAMPEKVWRAITKPEHLERWLTDDRLETAEPVFSEYQREVRYRLCDPEPPYLASTVIFQIEPVDGEQTLLKIRHQLTDARLNRSPPRAANGNRRLLMLAA